MIEPVAVDDAATREAARYLITEYLRWIASAAAANYGLSFDIDAMVTSDIEDRSKFYPPELPFSMDECVISAVWCVKCNFSTIILLKWHNGSTRPERTADSHATWRRRARMTSSTHANRGEPMRGVDPADPHLHIGGYTPWPTSA
jgi:hypothetical protein